jgi:hypothetical protein
MKRLDLIIPQERFHEVNELLRKHKVGLSWPILRFNLNIFLFALVLTSGLLFDV